MIDTQTDDLLSLAQAAAACPAIDGKRPSTATIWRWITKGQNGVRLDAVRVGRRIATTRPALDRFFSESANASPCVQRAQAVARSLRPTAREREAAMANADRVLARCGVEVSG